MSKQTIITYVFFQISLIYLKERRISDNNLLNFHTLLLVSENDLSFSVEMYYTTDTSAYRNCESSKRQVFANLKEAKIACFQDKQCVGVWNPECKDVGRFYTCKKNKDWEKIEKTNESNPSCLYRKQIKP